MSRAQLHNRYRCPAHTAREYVDEAGGNAYVYRFSYNNGWLPSKYLGVHHMADEFYTWGGGNLRYGITGRLAQFAAIQLDSNLPN